MGRRSSTPRKECVWKADSARDRAIQTAIGRVLQAQYDCTAPLPERLENLLKRLENADESIAGVPRTHARASQGSLPRRNWHPNGAL
jgi:hypothetical protein